jgi:hypothetical protein
MPQGKAVSEEVQWIVVRMAGMMSEEEISMYTQISTRKVRQIVSYFKSHGDVYTPARVRAKVHRSLSDDHINVSFLGLMHRYFPKINFCSIFFEPLVTCLTYTLTRCV